VTIYHGTSGDDSLIGGAGNDSLYGYAGNDTLDGGAGNDYIDPGTNTYGWDLVYGSAGNDIIDYTGASANGYYGLNYLNLGVGATFNINGLTNAASVVSSQGTTTILGIANMLHWGYYDGGLNFIGTAHNDTFNITTQDDSWTEVMGGAGADVYNLSIGANAGFRLSFSNWALYPLHGIVANLQTGIVSDDGFGTQDVIHGYLPEISATYFNDNIVGSANDDSFILLGGNDTLDGGAGFDRVRYNRSGVDYVNVNLATGIATGVWHSSGDGNDMGNPNFTHHLSNIERVQGSRAGNDTMIAGASSVRFQAYAGNDSLVGGAGNDTLEGGDGNDTLVGGAGNNNLSGGDGNDRLDASHSDPSGWGDWVQPGTGQDTVIGSAALFANGDGLDISWDDAAGTGGITVSVGANGTGTATSAIAGVVNTSFTYATRFNGTAQADIFHGSANANWEGWEGLAGNDTIDGGAGYDELLYNNDHWSGGNGAVTVNFVTGRAIDPFGNTDTFSNIEAVRGTAQGDLFIGNAALDFVSYSGLGGSDTIQGSTAWDRVDYSQDQNDGGHAGINANLATGRIIDGFGTTDFVSLIDAVRGTNYDDTMIAGATAVRFRADAGNDSLVGGAGNDTLEGGDGNDTLAGGAGNDSILGGNTTADLRDVIFGGDGNDSIDGGYGNDELRGDAGNDTIEGGYGADTVLGGAGNDVLTGSAWGDVLFGGDGDDFINGGFGFDRVNGGTGADRFFHIGEAGHGSDWIQDFSSAEGDTLVFGIAGATRAQFQINWASTANAGEAGVQEAFIVYRPTGQIIWALVDGAANDHIWLQVGANTYDLMS